MVIKNHFQREKKIFMLATCQCHRSGAFLTTTGSGKGTVRIRIRDPIPFRPLDIPDSQQCSKLLVHQQIVPHEDFDGPDLSVVSTPMLNSPTSSSSNFFREKDSITKIYISE
jgi:hypothetical protein